MANLFIIFDVSFNNFEQVNSSQSNVKKLLPLKLLLFQWIRVSQEMGSLLEEPIFSLFHNLTNFDEVLTKKTDFVSLKFFFKGCFHYIFARLFCMSTREHLWNKEKYTFHFELSFRSWDNQILNFQIFKCHDVIKSLSMKHETHNWITCEVNTVL